MKFRVIALGGFHIFRIFKVMDAPHNTVQALQNLKHMGKVIDIPKGKANWMKMDFTARNKTLLKVNLKDTRLFTQYIENLLAAAGAQVGYGGYGEKRIIYSRSEHFQSGETRCLHLGMDLWTKPNTTVYAPLNGVVHSFADNAGFGNYGPTLILSHNLSETIFYSLYGHLTKASLQSLQKGMSFKQGDEIGEIGNFPENGDWPPHLHFQLITDMLGMEGDFPGVARLSEREKYLSICPDPNLILRIV